MLERSAWKIAQLRIDMTDNNTTHPLLRTSSRKTWAINVAQMMYSAADTDTSDIMPSHRS